MLAYVAFFIFCLVSFLSGYILGKIKGKKLGKIEAELYAPLNLRIEGLKKGHCQVCGSRTVKKLKAVPHRKPSSNF